MRESYRRIGAYAETCAAIANVMLSWRLLLATGEPRFGDAIERTMYNAVLPGISLDGTHFFYTNPLQRRARRGAKAAASGGRASWYPCACCPPNLMRTLSTFEQLIATSDDSGVQLHQFASGTIEAAVDGDPIRLRVETEQPWKGRVDVVIDETPARPWALRIRVPAWLRSGTLTVGESRRQVDTGSSSATVERTWRPGERMVFDAEMPPRLTEADPRVDAVRGCVAIECGPLVYCVEQIDLPSGITLDDVEVDVGGALDIRPAGSVLPLSSALGIKFEGRARPRDGLDQRDWPYHDSDERGEAPVTEPLVMTAMPYLAWANRGPGPMRIWLPVSGRDRER